MNWRCDDDGYWPDAEAICWEEVEEFAGPEYLMYRDKMDESNEHRGIYRSPKQPYIPISSPMRPC